MPHVPTGLPAAHRALSNAHGSALHRTYAGAVKKPTGNAATPSQSRASLPSGPRQAREMDDASPARVFRAFADVQSKARWFAGPDDWKKSDHKLDFRVGGRESLSGGRPGGGPLRMVTVSSPRGLRFAPAGCGGRET